MGSYLTFGEQTAGILRTGRVSIITVAEVAVVLAVAGQVCSCESTTRYAVGVDGGGHQARAQ